MTTNIQPPAPLAPYLKNDTNANQHDRALQLMYDAILELQAKVVELETRIEALEP